MKKYFHFLANAAFDLSIVEEIIRNMNEDPVSLYMYNSRKGYFIADEQTSFYFLKNILPVLSNDLGVEITFLISHDNDEFTALCLEKAFVNYRNTVLSLYDIIVDSLIKNDQDILLPFSLLYKDIHPYLLETAYAFIQSDLHAGVAAKNLYIHRNTLLYRLSLFEVKTRLDVRNFLNASFFLLYIKISKIVHTAQE